MHEYEKENYIITIGGIKCKLELGKWSIASINRILLEAWDYSQIANERITFIIKYFMGTPFVFESNLPILPTGILRIRLESFDCVTFIYYMLALCRSRNFEEFVKNLYKLRYKYSKNNIIDNDPDKGNIFDFVCDSILVNSVQNNYIYDITSSIIDSQMLEKISVEIKRFRRPKVNDVNELYVTPKYGERVVTETFIPCKNIGFMSKLLLESGDLVLFSRGELNKDGTKASILIGHLAFTYKENNEIYFIHSTKHFAWRPDANLNSLPLYTGIFYDDNHKKEQLGVAFGGEFAGDKLTVYIEGNPYYGFNQHIKRTLSNYASTSFWGIKFYRIS